MNRGEVGGVRGREGWAKGQRLPLRPNTQGLQLGTWGPPGAPQPQFVSGLPLLKPDPGMCGFLLAPLVVSTATPPPSPPPPPPLH